MSQIVHPKTKPLRYPLFCKKFFVNRTCMKKTPLLSLLFSFVLMMSASSLFAFPGIQSYLKDDSGQYVYYRDYTFPYEAYVGILHYDEGTYGMRFYAPNQPLEGVSPALNGETMSAPKSVELLFTVNTEVSITEMTGEKFLTNITGSDTEIVNYLHDLIYEFSARRRKLSEPVVTGEVSSREDFSQFGGKVTMKYSFDIPIFNLKEIIDVDGKPAFQVATVGALTSSSDNSFFEFTGFPAPMQDKPRSFTSTEKKPNKKIELGNQEIKLDSQWTQAAENMYLLGDVAMIMFSEFQPTEQVAAAGSQAIFDALCRNLSLGTTGSYTDWGNRKIKQGKNELEITIRTHIPQDNAVSQNFKFVTKNKAGGYSIMTLTIFDNAYKNNRSYFDAIVKSYKVK